MSKDRDFQTNLRSFLQCQWSKLIAEMVITLHSPHIHTLQCNTAATPIQRSNDFPNSWTALVSWFTLAQRMNHRAGVRVLSLSLKRLCTLLQILLEPGLYHLNKSGLPCWRMKDHLQECPVIPAKVILNHTVDRWTPDTWVNLSQISRATDT